jgi:hypothetical protein
MVAMLTLVLRLWTGSSAAGGDATVGTTSLDSALAAWSTTPPSAAVVNAVTVPDGAQRDWLVALRRNGLSLGWTISDSSGAALVVEPAPLPESPARIIAIGRASGDVILSDDLGRIDSARTGQRGVAQWRATPIGAARASLGAVVAAASPRDSLVSRPVLVLGQAGWEAKFVVAALEEDGWSVVTRLAVGPGAIVRQGSAVRVDTSTLSAIVVLDSTSQLDASEVAGFVNDGGGLVASGAGVNHPALAHAASRAPVVRQRGRNRRVVRARTAQWTAGPDAVGERRAVALERRGDAPVVAARRVGSGRVIAAGYDDTWRLRMTPTADDAPASHRIWWSSLVSGVAHATPVALDAGEMDEGTICGRGWRTWSARFPVRTTPRTLLAVERPPRRPRCRRFARRMVVASPQGRRVKVAYISHSDCGRHDTGWRHPEHVGRLRAIPRALREDP